MSERIQDLKENLLDFHEQIQTIQALADSEKRDLTEDEDKSITGLFAASKDTEDEIDRRERIENQTTKLRETLAPKAEREQVRPQNSMSPEPLQAQSRIMSPATIAADRGKWGFQSFGEFAVSVKAAADMSRQGMGNKVDPRLIHNAPTTYGNEGAGADGGFAVPPDFREAIMEKVAGEDSLFGRTDQMTTSSNSITFPKDESTVWQSTGGIQTYWDGENNQLTQSKPQLKEENIRLNKLTSLVPVTEELLDDASAMDTYLRRKVPAKMDFALNNALINGTGAGQPTGILNAACLVSVAKETTTSPTQAADTIRFKNITDMWTRMYAPSRA
ncbi:MAG: phage major capsid protein, partial [Rhodospirillaceae bacterium]|nr:phage major capsid protein [Rhodospirillaceae bacterium]